MTDTRAAFEAHFQLSQRQAKRDNSGEYIDEYVQQMWNGWQAALTIAAKDTERLDYIAGEYLKVDPITLQSGGDDADVGWKLGQYHIGEKEARTLTTAYRDDLRAAIDAAMQGREVA